MAMRALGSLLAIISEAHALLTYTHAIIQGDPPVMTPYIA